MVSCDDIPEGVLGNVNFDLFIEFLARMVPNRGDRKVLGRCWSQQSGVKLTFDMWGQILNAGS